MPIPKIANERFALQNVAARVEHPEIRSQDVDDGTLTEDIAEYGISIFESHSSSRPALGINAEEQGRSDAAIALPPVDQGRGAWYVYSISKLKQEA